MDTINTSLLDWVLNKFPLATTQDIFLLQEDGFFLLQEDGFKIIIGTEGV